MLMSTPTVQWMLRLVHHQQPLMGDGYAGLCMNCMCITVVMHTGSLYSHQIHTHPQHTPTTVGLVTPLRPGNAAADTLRGGTRSHRDLSQSMQRSRNHHNAASGHHRHHQPHSATIREHADTIASTTSTGSAPPHQRRLESTRSRSSQRKHAGGSNTPTGATSTTATLSRASSRSIRGDDLDAHQAAATPTGGKGGGIDVQRGDDGDVPQGEAFEELVLSESPPAVDVHVSAVPRHQRSLSAGMV